MSQPTLTLDAYQLTTLLAHADAGRLGQALEMAFFFRKLPPSRGYVLACGQRSIVEHARQMSVSAAELNALASHPAIGPRLAERPVVRAALGALDGFLGEIDAVPEGTPVFAGPGRRSDGTPLLIDGRPLVLYTPLLQVRTSLLLAKLIETPWLQRLNHQSMIASKAARVVEAAAPKPVFEFGGRRTQTDASVDASWAAAVAGCAGTSNVAAWLRHGIAAVGTMDHFYVQAAEEPDLPVAESERRAFAAFDRTYGRDAIYLVDTYDTARGIKNAVLASEGRLAGVRIDSNVTAATIEAARALLGELGCAHARVLVSDGLDEHRVARLGAADGFGVGEQITCSPDAACGVGAVAKLVVNGYGRATMKLARGSGKMTLPGRLCAHRYTDHDLIALDGEAVPSGGRALLQPLWRGTGPVHGLDSRAALAAARRCAREGLEALPAAVRRLEDPAPWPLVASDALVELVARRVEEAACG
jgi:nicotinate phosphoribosyltransferase